MNTVEFSMRFAELSEEAYARMSGTPVDRIILYCQEEFEYTVFQYFQFLAEYSFTHNIPFDILVGVHKTVAPLHDTSNPIYKNIKIHHWGTLFITWLFTHLNRTKDHLIPQEPYRYPYVSMNAKPHDHRCLMMDILAKHNLIDRGAVSWLELAYKGENIRPGELTSVVRGNYKYKYWTPVIKRLTETNPNQFNIFNVPAEYKQSFVQLVVESCDRHHMASEKTWMPILYKKPFITLAAPNYHRLLQAYGFKLYDEYFDYSFDSDPDINVRAEAVAQNIARMASYPLIAQQKIYKRLLSKIEFNYDLALSLAIDINQIPEIIMERYQDPDNKYCSRDLVDFISHYNE